MKIKNIRQSFLAVSAVAVLGATAAHSTTETFTSSIQVLTDAQVVEVTPFNLGEMVFIGSGDATVNSWVQVHADGTVTASGKVNAADAVVITAPTPATYEVNIGVANATYTVNTAGVTGNLSALGNAESRDITIDTPTSVSLDPSGNFITGENGIGQFSVGLRMNTASVDDGGGADGTIAAPYETGLYTGTVSVDITL